MAEKFERNPEKDSVTFSIDDIITCPSDLTGIKWRIKLIDTKGILNAEVEPGQETSKHYPTTIQIAPEAQDKWKKVQQ